MHVSNLTDPKQVSFL